MSGLLVIMLAVCVLGATVIWMVFTVANWHGWKK